MGLAPIAAVPRNRIVGEAQAAAYGDPARPRLDYPVPPLLDVPTAEIIDFLVETAA